MNWFLIALINPIAHAFVNHLDKYIISRFVKNSSIGALILFSSLFSIFCLIILLIIKPDVWSLTPPLNALLLTINGGLLVLAITLYLYALISNEASFVAPIFQLIPVFGFVFGYFLLGESLNRAQLFGGALIVSGGVVLSLKLFGNNSLSYKSLILMTGSSLFYALNGVLFKLIASKQGFIDSLFWDMAGKFILGVILFFAVTTYRYDLFNLIKQNGKAVVGLNFFGEILAIIGEIALIFAVLYAPVAIVQSVGGLQPLFVLIFGIIITLFFPRLGRESLEKSSLAQKIIGIAIITSGVYLII